MEACKLEAFIVPTIFCGGSKGYGCLHNGIIRWELFPCISGWGFWQGEYIYKVGLAIGKGGGGIMSLHRMACEGIANGWFGFAIYIFGR